MHDRPTALELLEAVRHFLEAEAMPALEGTKKFHARVAANVLAIVARELRSESAQLSAERQRLRDLLGEGAGESTHDQAELKRGVRSATKLLCERIRSGDADAGAWRPAVFAHVRQTVIDKLAVANPKFLGAGGEDGL
ncbi:MAG: hypothetical protein HY699_06600 [Deltaproteobacteria bacterium]|nr:hypothetical protein [Deltaproteobacteria bacterium]